MLKKNDLIKLLDLYRLLIIHLDIYIAFDSFDDSWGGSYMFPYLNIDVESINALEIYKLILEKEKQLKECSK